MSGDSSASQRVLVVSSEEELPRHLISFMARGDTRTEVVTSLALLPSALGSAPDLAVIFDDGFDDTETEHIAGLIRSRHVGLPIILATVRGCEQRAIAALRAGYSDYIHSGSSHELRTCFDKYLRLGTRRASTPLPTASGLIGESSPMRAMKQMLPRYAASDCTVLVIGETGTGKERVAEQIHRLSRRAGKPMVAINCAALPDTLLESELFGYEKGAFTGAVSAYPGKIRLAEEGTLFLDEIGDMSLAGQAKLLRALESREFYRLGARIPTRFDVRIIAATNQPLEALVAKNLFRKDLYFRLNVAQIELPPLRERRDDIPRLLRHYLGEFNRNLHSDFTLDETLVERLMHYDWPGNIRELKNVLESMLICAPSGVVGLAQLPASLRQRVSVLDADGSSTNERDVLLSTLHKANWNKSRAAEALNWSRMTLYRKLAKYSIQSPVASESEVQKPLQVESPVTALV